MKNDAVFDVLFSGPVFEKRLCVFVDSACIRSKLRQTTRSPRSDEDNANFRTSSYGKKVAFLTEFERTHLVTV